MKYKLSESDIKELRYACRAGIIIPLFIILIANMILFLVVYVNKYSYSDTYISLIVFATFVVPVLIGFMMNRRFIADIRNGEKIVEISTIRYKEKKNDFEAGSGVVGKLGRSMNQFERYDLIIDNRRVLVEKELFEESEDGGEVEMYYAPLSRYLLQIKIHKPCKKLRNEITYSI